jgi:hypothetical protein
MAAPFCFKRAFPNHSTRATRGQVRSSKASLRVRVMSLNIVEWVEVLRPMEAHQAAETILSDIGSHPAADFREHDVETLAKALTAWAMLAKTEDS